MTAIVTEERFRATPITAETPKVVRRLAALEPKTIAIMHGSSISGEVRPVLEGLADYYDHHLRNALNA